MANLPRSHHVMAAPGRMGAAPRAVELLDLPDELIDRVFKHIPSVRDLGRAGCVCRTWRAGVELGLWITRTEDRVSLAPVPAWTIDEFPLPSGTPAGYVERNGWSQDGAWAEYSRTWYDPAAAHFVARQR